MAADGVQHSAPTGQAVVGVHTDHIEQSQGLGQLLGLLAVVLTDSGSLLPQLLQVFRQARDHPDNSRIKGWGAVQRGFLVWIGGCLGNKKPPRWAVRGGGAEDGFWGLGGMGLLDGWGG